MYRSPPRSSTLETTPAWQLGLTLIAAAGILAVGMVLPGALGRSVATTDLGRAIASGTIGTVLAIGSFLMLARLSGIPVRALFIDVPGPDAVRWGCLAVLAAILLTAGTIALTGGDTTVTTTPRSLVLASVAAGVAIGAWTATIEEWFVRGYVLAVLGHRWHWPGAIVATGVGFGLLHHGAADGLVGTAQYVVMTTVAGLFLGLLTVMTRSIWPAVAVHGVWNAAFSPHLVSLTADPSALIRHRPRSANWLVTAESYAPTESPFATALFLAAIIALLAISRSTCTPSKPTT